MMGLDESIQSIAGALAPTEQSPSARWRWGTVESVSEYGTMNVNVAGTSLMGIRAAQHCMGAQVGDRVRVAYYGTDAVVDAVRATDGPPVARHVLYSDPAGTTGNVALSESAAGFDHLIIYYMQNDGYCGSVDVFQPNGKSAFLVAAYPGTTTYVHWKVVGISGTSISVSSYARTNLNASTMTNTNTVNQISIYRVEAW